eukprot:COSAG02_NODE_519_length_20760_cov_60.588819_6_plen_263_part_00
MISAGFEDVEVEDRWWDEGEGEDRETRRPDITAFNPRDRKRYVIDVVGAWSEVKSLDRGWERDGVMADVKAKGKWRSYDVERQAEQDGDGMSYQDFMRKNLKQYGGDMRAAAQAYRSGQHGKGSGERHYLPGGELYTGPTHKMPDGSLHTGAKHSDDSEPLQSTEDGDLRSWYERRAPKENTPAPKEETSAPRRSARTPVARPSSTDQDERLGIVRGVPRTADEAADAVRNIANTKSVLLFMRQKFAHICADRAELSLAGGG